MTKRLSSLAVAAAVVAGVLCVGRANGGWVESRREAGGTTTTGIHVLLQKYPDPASTSTYWRAEMAGIKEFVRRFPQIFARKYRKKYEADPGRYGNFN